MKPDPRRSNSAASLRAGSKVIEVSKSVYQHHSTPLVPALSVYSMRLSCYRADVQVPERRCLFCCIEWARERFTVFARINPKPSR